MTIQVCLANFAFYRKIIEKNQWVGFLENWMHITLTLSQCFFTISASNILNHHRRRHFKLPDSFRVIMFEGFFLSPFKKLSEENGYVLMHKQNLIQIEKYGVRNGIIFRVLRWKCFSPQHLNILLTKHSAWIKEVFTTRFE